MRRFRQPYRTSAVLGCVDRNVHERSAFTLGDLSSMTTDAWGPRSRKEV